MTAMSNLDDPRLYQELDKGGQMAHLQRLPDQCRMAWDAALKLKIPAGYRKVKKVVVAGMGGSAIGGDLAGGLAALDGLEVTVHRDYGLPPGIDGSTLIVLGSYSGETEETLSSYEAALASPAKKLAITGGGRLKQKATEQGFPVLSIDYKSPPRVALGFGFIGLLGVLHNLGLVKDKAADMEETVSVLKSQTCSLDKDSPLENNLAKRLANQFYGRLAVSYGGGFLAAVARRWKTQFNENSKAWAFFEALPELNHNALVGYEFPAEISPHIFVAILRSPLIHPRIQLRCQITSDILSQRKVAHQILDGQGKSALAQMMSLIVLGDYTSYYTALLYGTDPTPVNVIDYLKGRLAQI